MQIPALKQKDSMLSHLSNRGLPTSSCGEALTVNLADPEDQTMERKSRMGPSQSWLLPKMPASLVFKPSTIKAGRSAEIFSFPVTIMEFSARMATSDIPDHFKL